MKKNKDHVYGGEGLVRLDGSAFRDCTFRIDTVYGAADDVDLECCAYDDGAQMRFDRRALRTLELAVGEAERLQSIDPELTFEKAIRAMVRDGFRHTILPL